MIGVTKEEDIKLWPSETYGSNIPDYPIQEREKGRGLAVVKEVVRIVEKKREGIYQYLS